MHYYNVNRRFTFLQSLRPGVCRVLVKTMDQPHLSKDERTRFYNNFPFQVTHNLQLRISDGRHVQSLDTLVPKKLTLPHEIWAFSTGRKLFAEWLA